MLVLWREKNSLSHVLKNFQSLPVRTVAKIFKIKCSVFLANSSLGSACVYKHSSTNILFGKISPHKDDVIAYSFAAFSGSCAPDVSTSTVSSVVYSY